MSLLDLGMPWGCSGHTWTKIFGGLHETSYKSPFCALILGLSCLAWHDFGMNFGGKGLEQRWEGKGLSVILQLCFQAGNLGISGGAQGTLYSPGNLGWKRDCREDGQLRVTIPHLLS